MKLNYFNDLYGWGTWIRTKIDGVRVRSSTVELSPKTRETLSAGSLDSEARLQRQEPQRCWRAPCHPPQFD